MATESPIVWDQVSVQAVFKDYCYENRERATRVLDQGFPPSAVDGHLGNTLLHYVVRYRDVQPLVPRMLAAGWDPNARNNTGLTPMHWACASGNVEVLQTLMAAGGRLDAVV